MHEAVSAVCYISILQFDRRFLDDRWRAWNSFNFATQKRRRRHDATRKVKSRGKIRS